MTKRSKIGLVSGALILLTGTLIEADRTGAGPTASAKRMAGCDRVADRGADPRRFARSLRRRETGCFKRGTYLAPPRGIEISRPGVTLRSVAGHRATLVGRLWVRRGAHGATIRGLDLDGTNPRGLPSPTVNADKVTFQRNEVTNRHSAICFVLGDDDYGRVAQTVIARNRIHDCGELPATNHQHGIYVAHARGTVIRNNLIYRNADRGIQLYPDADGSLITGNVIDGNGEGVIFGGDSDGASDNNVVVGNLLTNSTKRFNVESHWRGPIGTRNVVRRNCVFGGARGTASGGIEKPAVGFVAFRNLIADPLYRDREQADFALLGGSPCTGV